MPDLNDFYAFKMTTSGGGSGRYKTTIRITVTVIQITDLLIMLAIVVWFINIHLSANISFILE